MSSLRPPHERRSLELTAPNPTSLPPVDAAVHWSRICCIAADEDAYTADDTGRILQWTRVQGTPTPSLWREDSLTAARAEITELATAGPRVAWVESGEALCVASADKPNEAIRVASVVGGVSALRFSEDGRRLFVVSFAPLAEGAEIPEGWRGRVVVGVITFCERTSEDEAGASLAELADLKLHENWTARITDAAPLEWGTDFVSAQISPNGEMLAYGSVSNSRTSKQLYVPSRGVSRTTRLFQHRFSQDPERLIAFAIRKSQVVTVGLSSDRSKPVGGCPSPKPLTTHSILSPSSSCSSGSGARAAMLVQHRPSNDWNQRLIVADAEAKWVRQVQLDEELNLFGSPPMTFWGEDQLFFSHDRKALISCSLEDDLMLRQHAKIEHIASNETCVLRSEVVVSSAGETHGFFLTKAGELHSFEFATEQLVLLGTLPDMTERHRGLFPVTVDGEELLIITTHTQWVAYVLASGAELWRRQVLPSQEPLFGEGRVAFKVDRRSMQPIDPRTGLDSGGVVLKPESLRSSRWRASARAGGTLLFDPVGRCRGVFEPAHGWLIDPQGRCALVIRQPGVYLLRLHDPSPNPIESSETEPGDDAPEPPAVVEASESERREFPSLTMDVVFEGTRPTAPPVRTIPKAGTPLHAVEVTAIAADQVAFTGDAYGRIVRWDDRDGVLQPTLWKADSPPEPTSDWTRSVVALATRGNDVAWVEAMKWSESATLYVANVDSCEGAVALAEVPSVHSLVFSADGSQLIVACDMRFRQGYERPKEWSREPRVGVLAFSREPAQSEAVTGGIVDQLHDAWRVSLLATAQRGPCTTATGAALGSAGELMLFGEFGVSSSRKQAEVSVAGSKARATKYVGHVAAEAPNRLFAFWMEKGRVVNSSTASDQAKQLATFTPPKAGGRRLEVSSCSNADRSKVALVHQDGYSETNVVIADVGRGAARRLTKDELSRRPKIAFLGDSIVLLKTFGVRLWAVDAEEALRKDAAIRRLPLAGELIVDEVPNLADVEVTACATTETHVWAMTKTGEILRIGFDSPEVDHLGVAPQLDVPLKWLSVARDEEGEVLIVYGNQHWLAYDARSGAFLWHKEIPEGDVHGPCCTRTQFGRTIDSALVELWDPRSGESRGRVVELEKGVVEGWRVRRDEGWSLLIDPKQQSRGRFKTSLRTLYQDPKGRSAVLADRYGIAYVRLEHP